MRSFIIVYFCSEHYHPTPPNFQSVIGDKINGRFRLGPAMALFPIETMFNRRNILTRIWYLCSIEINTKINQL